MRTCEQHLILAGGGLANCLIALRISQQHPKTLVSIIESGPELGGNHTWSFHEEDVTAAQHAFLDPMIAHRWPAQDVIFPSYRRRLQSGYRSISSETLRKHMQQARVEVHTGWTVAALGPDFVEAADGQRLSGTAVIDGRGQARAEGIVLGFQKFFGREVETAEPHGIDCPVIMDATVSQSDGYRFIYLLPFGPKSLLIEDTRYSDGAELSDAELSAGIDEYAKAKGWTLTRSLREERGVLPIVLAADFDRFWPASESVARSGLRAGLFHPTTGYSLPQAVSLADALVRNWPLSGLELGRFTRDFVRHFWDASPYFRLLNRMLFRAGPAQHRYRVMEHFYTFPTQLICNFYAARLRRRDKVRVLLGKSPIPLGRAIALVREAPLLQEERTNTR
ncbi:MAG: lycopene beta-cyclase CrtY [Wenzhouxiangella sp.]